MHSEIILAISIYCIALICITIFSKTKTLQKSEFFLANKSFSSLPLAVSIMMTAFSAFNFTVFPADIAKNGLYITAALPVFFIVLIPLRRNIIPFFYRNNSISAYAHLSEYYSGRLHLLGAGLFILWRILWIGFTLYATAKVVAMLSDIPFMYVILLSGIIATIYSSLGGIKAVIWTDILQFAVLVMALIATLIISCSDLSLANLIEQQGTKPFAPFDPAFLSFNPSIRITIWSALIGTSVAFLARYGADQMIIQRYKSAKSLTIAKRSITLNALVAVAILVLLIPLGLKIGQFAREAAIIKPQTPPLKLFIVFMKAQSPLVVSLILTAMFSATMSSVDSGINAISASLSTDFLKKESRFSPRKMSLLIGTITIVLGLLLIPLLGKDKTLFMIINKIINGFGSPLLALILLSMKPNVSSEKGLFWGTIAGALFSVWSVFGIRSISIHYYSAINFIVTVLLISCVSLLNRDKGNN